MASPTPNKGFTYPAHGGAVNAWDDPLNDNFDELDAILGDSYNIILGSSIAGATFNSTNATISSTVSAATINSSLSQKLYYTVSGTISQDLTITFPAVGSFYIFNNTASGSFDFNVKTAAVASTTITLTGKCLVVTDGTSPYNIQPDATFQSGTALLFPQAAPPSGWTLATSFNDRVLRIVNTTGGGSGGSWTLSGFTVGNTTITTATMPSHRHGYDRPNEDDDATGGNTGVWKDTIDGTNTDFTGSGGSHSHSLSQDASWRPAYVNAIIATKD